MAANDYTRTVSITPISTAYSWDTPPSWITITQVGSTDNWTITIAVNTAASRTATLTVRHDNTSTTDTIAVSQAAGSGPTATPAPSPTSVPNPTATPNPAATASPTAIPPTPVPPTPIPPTPVPPTPVPPTPVPSATLIVGVQPTPTPSPSPQAITPTPFSSFATPFPSATPIPNPTATPFAFPTATPYSSGGGGGGGGCHLAGEMITMSNGEKVAIENISAGDSLLSVKINGMSNEELAYESWSSNINAFSIDYTSVNIQTVKVDTYTSYYNFNNDALKITFEHPILVKTSDNLVLFKIARDVNVGDNFLNENNEWISIVTKVLIEDVAPFTTYTIDVEPEDTYFANGVLVHNIENEKENYL